MGRRSGAQNHKSQEPRATSDLTRPSRPIAPSALWCGRAFLLAVFVLASLVFLSVDNALAQGTVATDRAALVALYNATGGADWTNNTNWLSNEPLSSWYGVTTDANGRVASINLSNNNLRGTIPAELGSLTNLVYLNLRQNMLSGEIPAELGSLTNLQVLNLYDNELSGTIPAELGQLTNLLWLALSDNELSGTIPAELSRLTNLEVLDLYDNELSGTIPAELGQLTNLLWLILSENILSGTIPAELSRLTNLEVLDLYDNELSGTIPAELGQLTNLLWLVLYENPLSGEIPVELGNLANLQILDLYENELSGEIPAALGDLANLQILDLSENELSGEIPVELGGLMKLQELILFDNTLSGPLPLTLSALSQLSVLDIRLTTLCAPMDAAFQAWLATINFHGAVCATRPPRGGGPPGGDGPRTSAPGAPQNLTVVGGNGEVVLSWDAPASDGGAAITDYEYRINRSGPWIPIGSTDTTHTVTGLDNGTEYTFQVRAVNAAGRSASTNRAEATPELFTLDFAHFANGAGLTSDLVFVNVGTQPIRPALYFYDQEGHLIAAGSVVDITSDLEIQEDGSLSIQTAMEPLGELTIATHGQGELVSGSVRVVAFGPIGGVLRFNLPDIGVAGVGVSLPVRDAVFPVRRQETGINTGVAIHNLESSPEIVRCELMREGVLHDAVSIPLAANGQSSWFIDEVFTGADTSDFAGSVHCDAAGPGMFTAVALELDAARRIFTTLPVLPTRRAGGRAAELNFAHFANGAGLTSDLVFVNLSTERSRPAPTPFHSDILPVRPALYFYDQEGHLIAAGSVVDITSDLEIQEDGSLSIQTAMEPLGELTIATHGRGELVSGSVRVIADEPIGGVLRFDLPGIGVAGVGVSSPVSDALFPVRRQEGGINTGVAVHNLGEEAMEVTCELMQGGTVLDDVSIPLAANGQSSWFINEVFTGADTSDFAGSVRCTAPGEGMFTGVAVELDAANRIFTTLPVVPVPERMSQE